MKIKFAIWMVVLRPYQGQIAVSAVMTLPEAASPAFDLRLRYNPELHLLTIRLPRGTRRHQVYDAFKRLTADECRRLYDLPRRTE